MIGWLSLLLDPSASVSYKMLCHKGHVAARNWLEVHHQVGRGMHWFVEETILEREWWMTTYFTRPLQFNLGAWSSHGVFKREIIIHTNMLHTHVPIAILNLLTWLYFESTNILQFSLFLFCGKWLHVGSQSIPQFYFIFLCLVLSQVHKRSGPCMPTLPFSCKLSTQHFIFMPCWPKLTYHFA